VYELLSAPIRKYIRDKRWEALRPIQNAAIERILSSDKNYILASSTASGKTEAAFLPILSKADFRKPGVRVLYISPLIALINDQFNRVEELCGYLDIPVTKWHGEANRTLKERLIKQPAGVILITPESIEAMFVNAPTNVRHLFGNLDYIVIDEIHSFTGTDRGIQLLSLIARIKQVQQKPFSVVGLSATIGDFQEAKKMTGDPDNTVVLRDKTAKTMDAEFKYFLMQGTDLPAELIEDLYNRTKEHKVLVFPNSRGRAEEVAVRLKRIAERLRGHSYYFSHHSSIDKELREYIEHFAKENKRFPFLISCTSTLELGIDIGSVDMVVQIDAASSIASLIQRVGRSGRKDGMTSNLLFYATDPWSLLQSLACLALYREEFIEPVNIASHPYDILLHQLLSTVKQLSECNFPALQQRLISNVAFAAIDPGDITAIVKQLIEKDILELLDNELIIGLEGEKIINSKDFYTVFKSEPNFKVVHQDKTIGEIPPISLIAVDENILLAAKIWKIIDIDYKAKKIAVIPAKDGKKPKFMGSGGDVHPRIREKMLEILKQETTYPELDDSAAEALRQLRSDFSHYNIEDLQMDRPLQLKENESRLFTFQGSRINRSVQFLLSLSGTEFIYRDDDSSMTFKLDKPNIGKALDRALMSINGIDQHLDLALSNNPGLIEFSKWGVYLPLKYQRQLLKEKYYDFEGAKAFLTGIRMVSANKPQ
jgi:ATP-dependent Lhr-like helicase